MSDYGKNPLSWIFIIIAVLGGFWLFNDLPTVAASGDHEEVRSLKNSGDIMALSDLIEKAGLSDMRILEAELEREHGRVIYEVEFLDPEGRVFEQYFDATTGEPLSERRRD